MLVWIRRKRDVSFYFSSVASSFMRSKSGLVFKIWEGQCSRSIFSNFLYCCRIQAATTNIQTKPPLSNLSNHTTSRPPPIQPNPTHLYPNAPMLIVTHHSPICPIHMDKVLDLKRDEKKEGSGSKKECS